MSRTWRDKRRLSFYKHADKWVQKGPKKSHLVSTHVGEEPQWHFSLSPGCWLCTQPRHKITSSDLWEQKNHQHSGQESSSFKHFQSSNKGIRGGKFRFLFIFTVYIHVLFWQIIKCECGWVSKNCNTQTHPSTYVPTTVPLPGRGGGAGAKGLQWGGYILNDSLFHRQIYHPSHSHLRTIHPSPKCISLVCGYPEKTHTDKGRTSKLRTNKSLAPWGLEPRSFLVTTPPPWHQKITAKSNLILLCSKRISRRYTTNQTVLLPEIQSADIRVIHSCKIPFILISTPLSFLQGLHKMTSAIQLDKAHPCKADMLSLIWIRAWCYAHIHLHIYIKVFPGRSFFPKSEKIQSVQLQNAIRTWDMAC